MSSNMQGMDTEYGRQVATEMDQHAGQAAEICGRLAARVRATTWVGRDKDLFCDDMDGRFIPEANNCADTLHQQARALNEHADRQDAVSS